MQKSIRHKLTGAVLYSGRFSSLAACLRTAAAKGTDLTDADLRNANLKAADLDGIVLRGACLDGANLSGANLSEAGLADCSFRGALLIDACLCFSDLRRCDFSDAAMAAADIAGALLDGSLFSTHSALTVNYRDAASMRDCAFSADGRFWLPFSRPPLTIGGLDRPVAILDDHIVVGREIQSFERFLDGEADASAPDRRKGICALALTLKTQMETRNSLT